MAIATGSTPLANEAWGLSNQMTARALGSIGAVGGPRCCKRDSYLAIREAVQFTAEQLGVTMELQPILCTRSAQNNQCIKMRCPFKLKAKLPNEETIEAIEEVRMMKENPSKGKRYQDVDTMMEDLL